MNESGSVFANQMPRTFIQFSCVAALSVMTAFAQDTQWLNWKPVATEEEFAAAAGWQRAFEPDGKKRILTISETSGELQIPAGRVRWARLLPTADFPRLRGALQLIGDLAAEPPAIEELASLNVAASVLPVPAGVDIHAQMDWTAFGVEERVVAEDGKPWRVAAGKKPAGLYSARAWRLPKTAAKGEWVVELLLQGEGEIEVGIGTKRNAEYVDPPNLEKVRLTEAGVKVRKVCSYAPGAEVRLCLVSLGSASQVRVGSVIWQPSKLKLAKVQLPRGVWNWSAKMEEWKSRLPGWKTAQISTLQLALPRTIDDGTKAALKQMRAGGFRVVAVEGDPHMILPSTWEAVLARLRDLNGGKGQWLDAIQYDVEPYLLPGFQRETAAWNDQWVALFQAIQKDAKVPVEIVAPYWLIHREGGRDLLKRLAKSASRIVVMNYRADPVESAAWASLWLEWSAEARCPVSIAAECGPIPDLKSAIFREAEAGPLWIAPWKDLGTAVVLFEKPVSKAENTRTFQIGRESVVPGSRTTLKGRPSELAETEKGLASVAASMGLSENLQPVFLIHEPTDEDLQALPVAK